MGIKQFILVCLLGTLLLSSCHNGREISKFFDQRRPEVIETECECPIDYNEECEEDVDPCEEIPEMKERDITIEDNNPAPLLVGGYLIQRGDSFDISVYDEDDTRVENVVVASDGKIYYLLLQGIFVEGKNIQEMAELLQLALTKFYNDPRVSITPRILHGLQWSILGRVYKPGRYPIAHPISLRNAIQMAGGLITETVRSRDTDRNFRSTANLKDSFLLRDGYKIRVDFESVLYSADNTSNIYLRPNDYIYIAPLEQREVYLLGAIRQPQKINFTTGMTLMSTLSLGGGWESGLPISPQLKKILVIRGSLKCPKTIVVDVNEILNGSARDLYLCPGDIIWVSNKEFRFAREVLRVAIESFVFGFVSTAGQFYAEDRWFPQSSRNRNNNNNTTNNNIIINANTTN